MSKPNLLIAKRALIGLSGRWQRLVANVSTTKAIKHIARNSSIPADLLATVLLLLLSGALIVNPWGLAPALSDILAIMPAYDTLRNAGNQSATSAKHKLEYWLYISTAFTLESILGRALISNIVPWYWLIKGFAAFAALPSPTQALTLQLRAQPITLPDREPSPSPVQAMLTALSPAQEDPYHTADMIRDNAGPYRVISPTGPLNPVAESVVGKDKEKGAMETDDKAPTAALEDMLDESAYMRPLSKG